MTDFTTETPMRKAVKSGPSKAEYYNYFGVIFLATLVPACVTWTLRTLRQGRLPEKGPFDMARTQANIITPMIFWA